MDATIRTKITSAVSTHETAKTTAETPPTASQYQHRVREGGGEHHGERLREARLHHLRGEHENVLQAKRQDQPDRQDDPVYASR